MGVGGRMVWCMLEGQGASGQWGTGMTVRLLINIGQWMGNQQTGSGAGIYRRFFQFLPVTLWTESFRNPRPFTTGVKCHWKRCCFLLLQSSPGWVIYLFNGSVVDPSQVPMYNDFFFLAYSSVKVLLSIITISVKCIGIVHWDSLQESPYCGTVLHDSSPSCLSCHSCGLCVFCCALMSCLGKWKQALVI